MTQGSSLISGVKIHTIPLSNVHKPTIHRFHAVALLPQMSAQHVLMLLGHEGEDQWLCVGGVGFQESLGEMK